MVWRLYNVLVWSLSLPSDNIFCSLTRPDMSDYLLYWKFSTYVRQLSSVQFSFVRYFASAMSIFCLVTSLRLDLPRTSVTLSTDPLLSMLVPSTVAVSGVTNKALNALTVFSNNLINGVFAIRADSTSALAVCEQRSVVLGKLRPVPNSSVENALVAGLGRSKFEV